LKASTGFPDSPIPQAQDSELRHVGDLTAGATSEDDARVGAARHVTCQELPRCAGIFKAGSFKRKLRGKMYENVRNVEKVRVKLV
jgi:hypothetical protein